MSFEAEFDAVVGMEDVTDALGSSDGNVVIVWHCSGGTCSFSRRMLTIAKVGLSERLSAVSASSHSQFPV